MFFFFLCSVFNNHERKRAQIELNDISKDCIDIDGSQQVKPFILNVISFFFFFFVNWESTKMVPILSRITDRIDKIVTCVGLSMFNFSIEFPYQCRFRKIWTDISQSSHYVLCQMKVFNLKLLSTVDRPIHCTLRLQVFEPSSITE